MATRKLSGKASARAKAAAKAERQAQREAERKREIRRDRAKALKAEKAGLDRFDFAGALKGNRREGVVGLRSLIEGLGAGDGYDLRYIDTWTLKQKRRVRDAFAGVRQLEAQPKRIIRPKSEEALKQYQKVLHPDVDIPGLKVAFYPYVEPKRLPGAKPRTPRVRLTKSGVTVSDGRQSRIEKFFDLERLAVDTKGEIERVAKSLGPGIGMVTVQVGEYETLRDTSMYTLAKKIQGWMLKYNGVTPFTPADGKKYWDRPEQHHYSRWLKGLVGYKLPKGETRLDQARRIEREFKARKAANAAERRRVKGRE